MKILVMSKENPLQVYYDDITAMSYNSTANTITLTRQGGTTITVNMERSYIAMLW